MNSHLSTKATLDKDLDKLSEVAEATNVLARRTVAPGLAFVFLVAVALVGTLVAIEEPRTALIALAAVIGGYMALNIGANDVTNNVGPAVGARAMSMGLALFLAAIFESAGALIAGDAVVRTIASQIVAPTAFATPDILISSMLAALISAALWINLATWIGAPVSTTHSIVGAVMGSGIAAAGVTAVNWPVMAGIVASWMLSPVMGGIVAAFFLYIVKETIIYRTDKIAAAKFWLPILVAVMAGAFTAFLGTKGAGGLVQLSGTQITLAALVAAILAWAASHRRILSQSVGLENRNSALRKLFGLPLILSAVLLSFAHGANDVANAVGPVAAIYHAAQGEAMAAFVSVPLWVMMVGAFGISVGLLTFGPKLIRMVGKEITRLNPMRAFCVSLSTAITVLIATLIGLPVSSTHTTVGAVFGVGFLREWYTANSARRRRYVERRLVENPSRAEADAAADPAWASRRSRSDGRRRRLVRRTHISTLLAAWMTTVPAAAALSALLFFLFRAVS